MAGAFRLISSEPKGCPGDGLDACARKQAMEVLHQALGCELWPRVQAATRAKVKKRQILYRQLLYLGLVGMVINLLTEF